MNIRPDIAVRYSKPLDIRVHKKDWLDIAYLRKMQGDNRKFTEHALAHPRRVRVERCMVCDSPERAPFGVTYGMQYYACGGCSHVYAEYLLTPEDLNAFYAENYFGGSVYLDKGQVQSRTRMILEPKLAYVAEFARPGQRRWLDVGTGNGGVVATAKAMGFEARGVELGIDAVKFAREMFDIELGAHDIYREMELCGGPRYDIVSFFMVLEHVTDPAEQVRCAEKLLESRGLLVVEIPKADSVAAMSDVMWADQGLRQLVGSHVMNYTLGSVTHLVEKNGFTIEGMWFMGQDVFSLVTHMAMGTPGFLESPLCQFLLEHNNALQEVIDRTHKSDEVVIVARKNR